MSESPQQPRIEFDESPESVREETLFDLSPHKITKPPVVVPDPPVRQRPKKGLPLPQPEFESEEEQDESPRGFRDRGTHATPIDLRRQDDRWLTENPVYDSDESTQAERASVRIDKQYLDVVKDNTLGIRRDESEVFYWLLDHARRISATKLENSGLREVQYINLMTEPDRFRGEPVTIEGDLWRLYEFDAGRNDYGVQRIYEGWVFTGDSANHPYRVVFTSLPRGIEPGENLRKPVRLTGYFFKREGYQSNGGVHFAPTLLARRIGINPMPNGIPLTSGVVPYMIAAMMAVGLALLVTIVGFAIGDERSMCAGSQRLRRAPHLSLAGLSVPTPVPVEETLRQFAERERQSAISGAYGPLLSRQTVREHAVHDYATSRQIEFDDGIRQHQQNIGVLQDWSAQQQSTQSSDAQRRPRGSRSTSFGDELDSDTLDQARNRVPKVKPLTSSTPYAEPRSARTTTNHQAPTESRDVHTSTSTFRSDVVTSHPQSIATPLPKNISYGASKLSEWEDEVTKMSSRASSQQAIPYRESSAAELAASQIERDRLIREQEIRERIQRQHAESDRWRSEQTERERQQRELEKNEHEHRERDRLSRELSDRNQTSVTRSGFDRQDLDSSGRDLATSYTLSHASDRHEHERIERERLEREHQERVRHERERLEHERIERERFEYERLERERVERERARTYREYDQQIDQITEPLESRESAESSSSESTDLTPRTPGKRGGGWGWPRRRKTSESVPGTDENTPDGVSDESNASDSADDSTSSSSSFGRRRKRRRSWRDGESSSQ